MGKCQDHIFLLMGDGVGVIRDIRKESGVFIFGHKMVSLEIFRGGNRDTVSRVENDN